MDDFATFLTHTRSARYLDYVGKADACVKDAAAFEAMRAHILARYAGLRAVRSLLVENDVFDCMISLEARVDASDESGCPEGSIPIRRITLEEMTRFQTLEDFLGKRPSSYPRL